MGLPMLASLLLAICLLSTLFDQLPAKAETSLDIEFDFKDGILMNLDQSAGDFEQLKGEYFLVEDFNGDQCMATPEAQIIHSFGIFFQLAKNGFNGGKGMTFCYAGELDQNNIANGLIASKQQYRVQNVGNEVAKTCEEVRLEYMAKCKGDKKCLDFANAPWHGFRVRQKKNSQDLEIYLSTSNHVYGNVKGVEKTGRKKRSGDEYEKDSTIPNNDEDEECQCDICQCVINEFVHIDQLTTLSDDMYNLFLHVPPTQLMNDKIQFFKFVKLLEEKCDAQSIPIRKPYGQDYIIVDGEKERDKMFKCIMEQILLFLQYPVRRIVVQEKHLQTTNYPQVSLPLNVFTKNEFKKAEYIKWLRNGREKAGKGYIVVETYQGWPPEFKYGDAKGMTHREIRKIKNADGTIQNIFKWTVRLNVYENMNTTSFIIRALHESLHIMAVLYGTEAVEAPICEERIGKPYFFRTSPEHDSKCSYCKLNAMLHHGERWQYLRNIVYRLVKAFLPMGNYDDKFLDDLDYPHVQFIDGKTILNSESRANSMKENKKCQNVNFYPLYNFSITRSHGHNYYKKANAQNFLNRKWNMLISNYITSVFQIISYFSLHLK